MFRTLIFGGLVASCFSLTPFSYTDCTTSSTPLGRLENLYISADPICLPGNVTGSVDVVILQPIDGSNLEVQVHVQKKVFMGYIDVPCLSNVGSCNYDLCGILAAQPFDSDPHHCPAQLAATSPDFNCACPFAAGTYRINPTTVFAAEPTGLYKFLARGEYRAKIKIVDKNANNAELACAVFYLATDTCGAPAIIG